MGSRIILPYGPTNEYIQKCIPRDTSLEGIEFPSLDEYMDTGLLDIEKITKSELRTAIEQQYGEWFSWFAATDEHRRLLAPIVGTEYDEYNLPILHFPRFVPLVDEGLVYKYNNTENLITMGMRLGQLNITEEEVLDFLREIPILCGYLDLNEEDILNNPSNIGYNPTFGLRIIDYGLAR